MEDQEQQAEKTTDDEMETTEPTMMSADTEIPEIGEEHDESVDDQPPPQPIVPEGATMEKQVHPKPGLGILMGIQRNMFSDVALQDIGHVILGTAYSRDEYLNDHKHYLNVNFSPEEHNDSYADYVIQTTLMWRGQISRIMEHLESATIAAGERLKTILTRSSGKIVAGTMRIHVTMDEKGDLTATLMWVEKRKL